MLLDMKLEDPGNEDVLRRLPGIVLDGLMVHQPTFHRECRFGDVRDLDVAVEREHAREPSLVTGE